MKKTNSTASLIGYSYSNKISKRTSNFNNVLYSCDASQLQVELDTLRETTKEALQLSWDEVEALQTKLTSHAKLLRNLKRELEVLKEELDKSRRREFDCNSRNSQMEAKLVKARQANRDRRSSFSSTGSTKSNQSFSRGLFASWNKDKILNSNHQLSSEQPSNIIPNSNHRQRVGQHNPGRRSSDINCTWHHPLRQRVSFSSNTETYSQEYAEEGEDASLSEELSSMPSRGYPRFEQHARSSSPNNTIHSHFPNHAQEHSMNSSCRSLPPLNQAPSPTFLLSESLHSQNINGGDCDRPSMDAKDATIRSLRMKLSARDEAIASMEETISQNIKVMQQLQISSASSI
mmetsp:Transcript_9283/g.13882  ORF Transcript_9283/g.13882 Transcript_9283/m.13882 type:complete len:346 (+) Transcript_9283:123-1160(+)|eukprot:CAMPEP_0194085896 /NCGR_PEP_ID=MMETSP0149-20130528/19210_1 /TAXON_ID=122233 /ORGANISM="Chaetoceros debilis, Strain MM31A-1" /LENGTH=345 /DNA_ID=CAMNT_0038768883 /DNA_START=36 /DNA_END=1073 /DNA_ORIENTATION=-